MPADLRTYAFESRHAGRIVADRECAIAEVSRVLPAHRTMAFDSAALVFRAALAELGVPHLDVDDSALPAMFRVASRVGIVDGGGRITNPAIAMDAAASKSFDERFPDVARVRRAL